MRCFITRYVVLINNIINIVSLLIEACNKYLPLGKYLNK